MTKNEWFSSLSKCIKSNGTENKEHIIEYYEELFCDKQDEGKSEAEILKEFGNPYEVAYKLNYSHDDEGADFRDSENSKTSEVVEAIKDKVKHTKDSALPIVLKTIFFIPYFVLVITAWSLMFSFACTAFSFILAAPVGIVVVLLGFASVTTIGVVVNIGALLVLLGLGILFVIAVKICFKPLVSLTVRYFYKGKYIK